MSNLGTNYSKIIHPKDYNHIMSNEHLYISLSDRFIVKKVKELIMTSTEVLELGCGPGRVLSLVSEIEGINITGIDLDEYFIDYARGFIKKPNIRFISGDVKNYRHPKKYDIIYSQGFHHHVSKGSETYNYLKNVYNNLKEGGHYIVSDEFIPHYNNSKEREIKIIIWYSHIISHAKKKQYNYLAQEEAKTLLDDLFEGRIDKNIKSSEQVGFVISKVDLIDQAARKEETETAAKLAEKLLSDLEAYNNLTFQGDVTIDLSRGDYKICDQVFRQEVKDVNLIVESVKSFGPVETIGGMSIYVLRKG
jgi:cyclopropane fatty-acyl-phospholipid synthase-like methyltransferase